MRRNTLNNNFMIFLLRTLGKYKQETNLEIQNSKSLLSFKQKEYDYIYFWISRNVD